MNTKFWVVDKHHSQLDNYPQIKEAARLLQENEVVAFPTETVYGLGANAKSNEAVDKIYQAKGRPSDNPLIVHIASFEQVDEIAQDVSSIARKLMTRFWPGPLTLVLNKRANAVSEKVTPDRDTVAIRMPDHPIALALITEANLPLAAPSANLSGKPSPTLAEHVSDDLTGRIAGILDGGATGVGLESTVLDCSGEMPVILRPGGITKEQLEEVCGPVEVDRALLVEGQTPKAPGMKYKHYAPTAPLYIVNGTPQFLQSLITKQQGSRVGVLATDENSHFYDADVVISCGSRESLSTIASNLYDSLRAFDKKGVDIIYSEAFPSNGIGQAIMNRLEKAAEHKFIFENGKRDH